MNYSFRIINEYERIGPLCRKVQDLLEPVFSTDETDEIMIGFAEALNNVVEHSYRDQTDQNIDISLVVTEDSLEITITDFGQGMSSAKFAAIPDQVQFDPETLESFPEGGMGISLIKSCMDNSTYQPSDAGNVLTLVKHKALNPTS